MNFSEAMVLWPLNSAASFLLLCFSQIIQKNNFSVNNPLLSPWSVMEKQAFLS